MTLNIGMIGVGAWPTSLTVPLIGKYDNLSFWVREEEKFEGKKFLNVLEDTFVNKKYLPGFQFPKDVKFYASLENAVKDKDLVVIGTPSQYVRNVVKGIKPYIEDKTVFCSISKGIENESFKRMSQIIREELKIPKSKVAVLSGPSHAEEVSRGLPTKVVAASRDDKTAKYIQDVFSTDKFKVYTTDDIRGVEYGGTFKNIVAIAAGLVDGMIEKGIHGDNTKAAIVSRGFSEMLALGWYRGAGPYTFGGLSGLGDLNVTCYSKHSRNRTVGKLLSNGKTLEEISSEMYPKVPEGIANTKAVYDLAKKLKIDLPITNAIYDIMYNGKEVEETFQKIMEKDSKPEHESLKKAWIYLTQGRG